MLSLLPQRYLLIGQLLYGCGLRISECLRLRIRDFDFDQGVIRIFDSKGNSSRLVSLPESLVDALMQKIQWRREIHLRGFIFAPKPFDFSRLGDSKFSRDFADFSIMDPFLGF